MSLISIVMLSLSCAKNPQSLNTVGAFEQTLGIINGTPTLPQNATALCLSNISDTICFQ
jgi:hypothetical protein